MINNIIMSVVVFVDSASPPQDFLPVKFVCCRVVNETYDAETETRRSKRRLETFGRDVQAVSKSLGPIQLQLCNV